jgi:hypothetical protein
MRYFKNEPTKLTLGTHSYTPTQETFFRSSNRESFGVSRKHNYIPPTPKANNTTKSSRYVDSIHRKHHYVPSIGNNSYKNKNNHGARTFPSTGSNNNRNVANQYFSREPNEVPPKVDIDTEIKASLLKERQEQERLEKEQRQEKDRCDKEQEEREKQKRFQEEEAALKLQAFVRGALCRTRVSNMLLRLIQGLLAAKERRQRQLEEEKEREREKEEVVETPRSQQYVFAALDADGDDQVVSKHERADAFVLERQTTSILRSPKRDTMDGRSIGFVDSKNQVHEIDRAMEYVHLPEWWMAYVPHGTLRDDEIDDRYAVVTPSQWVNEEEKEEEVEISTAFVTTMSAVKDPPVSDDEFEIVKEEGQIMEDVEEYTEQSNQDIILEKEQVKVEEIVEEEESMVDEQVIEEEYEDEAGQEDEALEPEPEFAPALAKQSPPLVAPRTPELVSSPMVNEKSTEADTTDTADPSDMSLAERMKHFQKGSQAPVKKNFRATTFR